MVAKHLQMLATLALHAIFIHYFYLESCGDPTHDANLNLCRSKYESSDSCAEQHFHNECITINQML